MLDLAIVIAILAAGFSPFPNSPSYCSAKVCQGLGLVLGLVLGLGLGLGLDLAHFRIPLAIVLLEFVNVPLSRFNQCPAKLFSKN